MDESDQQMAYLTQHINQHRREILDTSTSENVILANLARVNHDIALDYLHNIVNVNFGNTNSTLVILTGIQINMPRPALQEFFKALSFTIQYNNGTIMDLFDETFNKPQQEETKKRPTQKK